jgi:small-conductance mechanosensitive channel
MSLFAFVDRWYTKRRCRRGVAVLGAVAASLFLAIRAVAAPPPPDTGKQLIGFLERETGWYRQVSTFAHGPATPEEVLLEETVAESAQKAIAESFLFAENQAVALTAGGPAAATTGADDRLAKLVSAAVQRVGEYRAQIDALDEQMRSAKATSQPVLTARRAKIASELSLAEARLAVLQQLAEFASEGAGGGLTRQVEELKTTVPDAQVNDTATTQPAAAAATVIAASQQPIQISSMGILGLIEEMFSLSHKAKDVKDLAARTDALHKAIEQMRAPISAELMDAIHRADALAAQHDTDDPNVLASQRKELDALTGRFNLLASAAIPLRMASTYLDTTHSSLVEWENAVHAQYYRTLRYLLTRLGVMGGLVLLTLLVSQIWRRATFRYVTDVRRRRQFLFVRRLIVGGIVMVIVLGGFVTEFGSLATYAGLLTAGIAVALQSVILSGVSHFFFMGRYGVRVGDRVTINGITGDVIDIGIFRMYMMELDGKPNNLQPTGRIVVFSNSVLFQPNAFYKQIPGAEYNWHELGLTLSPDSDYHLAETRLMAAVASVYNEYKATIEQQHEAARNALHIQLPTPQIQGRMRFVDSGLEFVVRYPVEMRRAAEIDDKITRALLQTIEQEPRLKLVATSTPKIQAADGAPAHA